MDVLINSLIVCFGVGFIASLQVWLVYRQSYLQLQIDDLIQSMEYMTDLLQHPEKVDSQQPIVWDDTTGEFKGFHNGIHDAPTYTKATAN